MHLLITIDTECDNAWAKSEHLATENARFLPRFQRLCEKFGYKPSYLVSYEMAEDGFFRDFALDTVRRDACEIGSHPHPWNSPPDYELTDNDMKIQPFLIEYPERIMKEKVKYLTGLLEDRFGVKIRSHRAGRWAFNETYAKALAELGYSVDCSITPLVKLDVGPRPPAAPQAPAVDYTDFPDHAYYLDLQNISKTGKSSLLEIPMTTVSHYGKLLMRIYDHIPGGNIQRVFRLVFGRPVRWFRPHRLYHEMPQVASMKLRAGADYIMFMLHSSELMPGGSPIFRNQREIEDMYEDIGNIFTFLKACGVQGFTCRQYYEYFTK